ncbi:RNA polymerase II-associated protein [Amylostereum chailletii]|nr:RNA polymerase II-associated protein [Amylostereum chailletii]
MSSHSLNPWNTSKGRTIDIELGGQEVITIELDLLGSSADDVVEVLKEGQPKVSYWTRLGGEALRRGYLDMAENIALAAVECFQSRGSTLSLPPIYCLLANIQLSRARQAPKMKLPDARQDIMTSEKSREEYMREATQYINNCDSISQEQGDSPVMELSILTRGIHQLASRSLDDALRSFDGILAERPTNLVALMGKGRILYARRQYQQALKIFQHVLMLNPQCVPDPRIGIGLCFWAMNHKDHAKAAWLRSVEVNPSEWSGHLLLGLEALNASKDPALTEQDRARYITTGSKLIEKAFNGNQRNAAAANALCDIFLRKGQHKRALKLAERTIQFSDTVTLLTEGYIRAGRVCHVDGANYDATSHYTQAAEGQPKNVIAALGLVQMQIRNDEIAAAIRTLDALLQPPNPQRSHEAMAMLASLRMYPRLGMSTSEAAQEKLRARDLFDRVLKAIELHEEGKLNSIVKLEPPPSKTLLEDMDMYVEIGRLWQKENLDRTRKMLQAALKISEASGAADPRLLNNLGVLSHMDNNTEQARSLYESALTGASALGSDTSEGMSTSILYNLARIYEDLGSEVMSSEAYEKLLARHPEYVDAKIRQADMLAQLNQRDKAHELLKDSLASQNGNLNLRAFYTHFLIQSNLLRPARDFVFATLKDHDKHDVYALCAAGWLHYQQAREVRDPSSKAQEDRKMTFRRSAEFYEKALSLDSMCAFAAQGLAIVSAEDALGTLGGALPPGPSPDDAIRRVMGAREALDVFAKVRESTNDGSVYVNMGHCYFALDEFERAIESYETASKRYYNGLNVSVMLCLCRSWYAKANRDQSFTSMNTALSYAQRALHIQPSDKVTVYNIAMIQQKAAEMLFSLKPDKRTLKDLERAIQHAGHAQKLFAALAADSSAAVPYSRDIADQRKKYGDSMLRRADDHLTAQRQYEAEQFARLDAARQKRQEEKLRLEAIEREKAELLAQEAEALRLAREEARQEAKKWTEGLKAESDDERERKARKAATKKAKAEVVSGDEATTLAANGEPKKKRSRKLKKAGADAEVSDGEEEALFSGDDEDKPSKKRSTKKRVIRDDDEEELAASAPRKKQFKSKEVVEDSDEDMS